MKEGRIDRDHASTRSALRLFGPLLLAAGAVLMVIGAIRMFSPAWSDATGRTGSVFGGAFEESGDRWDDMSRRHADRARRSFGGFGMVAGGMVLLAVGAVLTKFGYMGRVARYAAGELAPVATDTLNYVADESSQAVRSVSSAIAAGIHDGRGDAPPSGEPAPKTVVRCHKCNAANDADDRFCGQCGAELLKRRPCPSCGELNDGDAKFCDNCGLRFEQR